MKEITFRNNENFTKFSKKKSAEITIKNVSKFAATYLFMGVKDHSRFLQGLAEVKKFKQN